MGRLLRNIRRTTAGVIAWMPLRILRLAFYRLLLGYRISLRARIGLGTLIDVREASIGNADIGRNNRFTGPMELRIDDGANVGARNIFECAEWATPEYGDYGRYCRLGASTLVTSGHMFDVTGGFELADGAWIAGYGTQVWTHGAGATDREVHIGAYCYIGSAARFAPGSLVGPKSLVAMGSVVVGKFPDSRLLIGGCPAKIVRTDYVWKAAEKGREGSQAPASPGTAGEPA